MNFSDIWSTSQEDIDIKSEVDSYFINMSVGSFCHGRVE